jgi:hypothetical protein
MKRLLNAAAMTGILLGVVSPLSAQWAEYPKKAIPRNPDGTVNLTAPAPRTADGKPDFTGIWGGRGGGGGGGRGAAQPAGQAGAAGGRGGGRGAAPAAGAAAPAAAAPAQNAIPTANFGNVAGNMPGGLPMQPWAAELVRKRMADNSKDNPDALCLPMGFMQFHTHPEPRKMIQTPDVLVIIYEANFGLRQIFTDGRPLPNRKDVEPWWYGYSVGKWEGDTLVVQTTGFLDRDPIWLDVRGSPLTEEATVTEKFRRTNFGTLEIEVTVDDPKAYTKPWTVRLAQRYMPDTELIEFICEERDAIHYVGAPK